MQPSRWTVPVSCAVSLLLLLNLLFIKSWYSIEFTFIAWKLKMSENASSPIDAEFKSKPLVLWVMDQHLTPVKDMKHLLPSLGVKIVDKNIDPYRCHLDKCLPGPKVINGYNAVNLNEELMRSFYDAYKNDAEMRTVDAFVCFHLACVCELYLPFNKSIIIISTHRYEWGRHQSRQRLTDFNNFLTHIAADPRNFIGANNLYDANYIKYFTGIDTRHVPSACDYMVDMYNQSREGYILHRSRDEVGFLKIFIDGVRTVCQRTNCSVKLFTMKKRYPGRYYKHSNFTAHRGVVLLPQQVSTMHAFELYRQNIPLFFPTKELLVQWEYKYHLMYERISVATNKTVNNIVIGSLVGPHPSQVKVPDPNRRHDLDSTRYWVKFADMYQWPHIVYYNSIPDLVEILDKMTSADLWKISEAMKKYNAESKRNILTQWRAILENVAKYSPNSPR